MFGDSDRAQAGDVVLAIGNPLGLSGSVTDHAGLGWSRSPVVPKAARAAHDYSAGISDKVQRGRKRCCMAWSEAQSTSGSAE